MKLNENNPTNSPSVQWMLDVDKGIEKSTNDKLFTDKQRALINKYKNEIDNIWNGHQYPMDSLVFTRLSRETGIILKLPLVDKTYGIKAVLLLLIIMQNIGPSLCFALSRQDAMDLLNCSKNPVKGAFNTLLKYGIIAVLQKGIGRGNPTIYMLNPMVADVGKKTSKRDQELFWELAGDLAFCRYLDLSDKETTVDTVKAEDHTNYVVIRRKTEEELEEQKKKQEIKKRIDADLFAQQNQEIDSIL